MDSFELNKILGAVLATCLGVLSINIAAGPNTSSIKFGAFRKRFAVAANSG